MNPHLHKYRFTYEDDKVAGEMFDVGDFIFSCDLKSAYHHIEIFEVHQQYLGFAWIFKAKYDISYSLFSLFVFPQQVIFVQRF
jgi:hypothetical protein